MQTKLPANHGAILPEYHRDGAVVKEVIRRFEALYDDSPEVPLLVDCEVFDDINQLVDDEVWEGALASEADNDIISKTENGVNHLLFGLEMTYFTYFSTSFLQMRKWLGWVRHGPHDKMMRMFRPPGLLISTSGYRERCIAGVASSLLPCFEAAAMESKNCWPTKPLTSCKLGG
jgi:hypothetical protein